VRVFIISLLLFPLIGWCQLNDDFSDGDFTNNPTWLGDQNLFKVNTNFQLQLNHNEAGTAYLSSIIGLTDSLEWHFSIRLAFSPSGSNNARVYLLADNSNLSQSLNGYYLQFGEALGEDAIQLFHQQGEQIQSICRGTNGGIATSFDIDVKVIYSSDGNWNIFVDWDKNGNFIPECSGLSLSDINNPYFGLFCSFTSSYADNFFLDNVSVNYIIVDTEPPIVENIEVVSANKLSIQFNEPVEILSAENTDNYYIQLGDQTPLSASLNLINPSEVLLEFSNDFPANQNLDLQISNIKDLADNVLESGNYSFIYNHALFADVVFNEIMADPTPSIGLPEVEYLEIYNTADYDINLTNWKLKIGDTEKTFNSQTLMSGEYLILCNTAYVDTMEIYGSVASFSSFSLTNTGQSLSLINELEETIDEVSYTNDWYQDNEKASGGWSLEKIQAGNICLTEQNWTASINSAGGTPGAKNSVFSDVIFLPEVLSASIKNDSLLTIIFNQKMDSETLSKLLYYDVDQSIGNPKNITISDDYQSVDLIFADKFNLGFLYELSLKATLKNCVGQNLSGTLIFNLELSKIAGFADVVFNEIMADPSPSVGLPEVEYLEIYNRTAYPIDLTDWKLKIGDAENDFSSYTLKSDEYLILCNANFTDTMNAYNSSVGFSSFSLTNDGQSLSLINCLGETIDVVNYTNDWYQDNDKASGGWSIEKIQAGNVCLSEQNWTASIDSAGGTPGGKNSVFSDVIILPEVLSTSIKNDSILTVIFNQVMQDESLKGLQNYTVNQSIGHPKSIIISDDYQSVDLIFENIFSLRVDYQLTLDTDLKNCIGQRLSGALVFDLELSKIAEFADVVFNEIMADPNPSVGLPEIEYLEVYNRTAYPIDLTDWKLKIGDAENDFSSYTLKSDEYLILCNANFTETMNAYNSVVGFSNFSLTNDGQSLTLINALGETIDVVNYTNDWYQDNEKASGGWSIEKIQAENICLSEQNWKASIDSAGGTPGEKNSVFSELLILPEALSASIKNDSILTVFFNQVMQDESLNYLHYYTVDQSIGNPKSIIISDDYQSIDLIFDAKFNLGVVYELSLDPDLKNCIGQKLTGSLSLSVILPKVAEYGDIIINEIMADPDPSQGLPNTEYLELFNRTLYPIILNGWSLNIGSSLYLFSEILLRANSFLIITHLDNINLFNEFGDVLAMPSFNLSNSGTSLVLKNNLGQLIHYLNYTDIWYKDDFKAEGGWSLEMISSDYFCEQSINWSASENHQGGTPGSVNSLNNRYIDYQMPKLEAIDVINQNTLLLHFSKSMDSLALKNPHNYYVDNDLGTPLNVEIFSPKYDLAQISFADSFVENIIYDLNINSSLIGCCGFELENLNKLFAMPQEAESGDIIINEILFNAWLDDGEYVELYNRSDKVIDSRKLLFSRVNLDIFDSTYYSFQINTGQLFPDEYLLLCKNKTSVLDVYYSENPDAIFEFDNFPLLPNIEGNILLSKASNKSFVIDAFNYKESMHNALINNTQGVSLERLSPEIETNSTNNWTSAAANVNYGSPAYQNSQFQTEADKEKIVQIYPEIFSPDLDGIDDLLQINYDFEQSGYTLNLLIFNAHGQNIRHLIKNELMGVSGQIFWDGITEEGDKAAIGIYILYFEYFDLTGKVEKIKKTCVLGGKL
jgi:hypothetical protein